MYKALVNFSFDIFLPCEFSPLGLSCVLAFKTAGDCTKETIPQHTASKVDAVSYHVFEYKGYLVSGSNSGQHLFVDVRGRKETDLNILTSPLYPKTVGRNESDSSG